MFKDLPTGPVHAINDDLPGFIYVVSGTRFYRIAFDVDPAGIVTDLGDVGNAAGPFDYQRLIVTIAVGPPGAVAVVPPNGFTCAHVGLANQLGGTFPGDAQSVAYFDGYYVFTQQSNAQNFFISRLADPTDFDALDFASATEQFPNSTLLVRVLGSNLWFVGYTGIEIWYDTGAADFPFRRMTGVTIELGTAAPRCVAVGDGSLFWVTVDGIALRSVGFQTKRISTHAIEEIIRGLGTAAISSGFLYTLRGHAFYVLNWPSRTLSYDLKTETWHDRSSSPDGSGRWIPDTAARKTANPVLGSSTTGRLYVANPNIDTEDGVFMLRQATFGPLSMTSAGSSGGTARVFCSRVEVEMETGSFGDPGQIVLEWSDDGGRNFSRSRVLNTGLETNYRKRVFTTRLGSFRERIFRVSGAGHVTLYAMDADLTPGSS